MPEGLFILLSLFTMQEIPSIKRKIIVGFPAVKRQPSGSIPLVSREPLEERSRRIDGGKMVVWISQGQLVYKSLLCERCSEEEGKVISSVHSIIKTETNT